MLSYDLVECTFEVDPNDDSLLLHTCHGKGFTSVSVVARFALPCWLA